MKSLIASVVLALSFTAAPAMAAENPFSMGDAAAIQTADSHEGKCGEGMKKEGKCGEGKKEGKCGEGKCGEGKKEGKCGEGKCGDGMKKEGKCGGKS